MTQTKSFLTLLALVLALLALRIPATTFSAQTKPDQAPSFTLKLLNGGELKSAELKGKVAILKFMASW